MRLMAARTTVLLLVALTAIPATARVFESIHMEECNQPPTPSASNRSVADIIAYRAKILTLLHDLPSAADPTGFASLHSGNEAYARGLCFGNSWCVSCLSELAKKIADACDGNLRAAAWDPSCFITYADTNTSTPYEDAYRGLAFQRLSNTYNHSAFYNPYELADLALSLAWRASNSTQMMATLDKPLARKGMVHAVAFCARDITLADCARCLEVSAGELLPKCCGGDGLQLKGQQEGVAAVAGFNCHIKLEINAPDRPFLKLLPYLLLDNLDFMIIVIETLVVGLLVCFFICWSAQLHYRHA